MNYYFNSLAGTANLIGERYERRSRRLIERLAALLEPAVILVLLLYFDVLRKIIGGLGSLTNQFEKR